jgi:hypothetical protein
MLPEFLGLGLSLALSVLHPAEKAPAASLWPLRIYSFIVAKAEPPSFRPADRAVSNWRREAMWNVALAPSATIRLALGKDADSVSRCVKLNNYWCIKKAGWNGEIASDAEGHVAFASALEGATVAALLLRHYYIDLHRRSALAIISRWAPAQCNLQIAMPVKPLLSPLKVHAKLASTAMTIPSLSELSVHDFAATDTRNTVHARGLAWHARHAPRQTARTNLPLHHSIVRDHMPAMMPAPEIAVGMGERNIKLNPVEYTALGLGKPLASPMTTCTDDGPRIAAYARHAIEGVVPGTNDDLQLFAEDGSPTQRLAQVVSNMAAVEIGPLLARAWLIEAGIAAAAARIADKTRQDAASARQP